MIKDNSYKIALTFAIVLHILLLALLCIKFAAKIEQPVAQSSANIVKAFSISQSTVDQYFAKVAAEKKQILQVQEQAQQAQEQASLKRQELQKQAEQKMVEAKKEKIEQALKQQMLAEQIKEAQIIKKQEKKLEDQQKVEAKKQEQQKLQDSLQKQLANEAKQLQKQGKAAKPSNDKPNNEKAVESSKSEASKNKSDNSDSKSSAQSSGEIDKYKALVIQAISQEWIVPDGVDKDATCKLLVKVAPGGIVLGADIIKSSGNELLDHSAQTAVLKASPLPVPKDEALFDSFRLIQLTVRPQEIVSG